MENLEKLKKAILQKKDPTVEIEACYTDLLNNFEHPILFLKLIEMCESTDRIKEIYKVMDFVRFPVKRAVER